MSMDASKVMVCTGSLTGPTTLVMPEMEFGTDKVSTNGSKDTFTKVIT